ncbi:unnamed protein product [Phytophthora fragariaefolia]|uniref:Unnamed protein product n=1 Tax=Phytophthora fragariaefolia TaxID=1490495 RepID=A0A9W6YBV8_9STRA|nr:unnamed protein product [Phytophthora fragariaefolia]
MMIWLRRLLYTIGDYECKVLIVYYECATLRPSNSKDSGTLSKTTLSPTGMWVEERRARTPKDVLFMTLGTFKHCGSWDVVSSMFNIDASPLQKMIKKFLDILEPYLYDIFVVDVGKRWTMKQLTLSGHAFENFPSARYATDVTFQQANRPTGGYHHAKKYFSGKHFLYGYKVEVSVLPTGAAINCTKFAPGAEADLTMFRNDSAYHRSALQKLPNEFELSDDGPLLDQYANDWAVLVDKGYQVL